MGGSTKNEGVWAPKELEFTVNGVLMSQILFKPWMCQMVTVHIAHQCCWKCPPRRLPLVSRDHELCCSHIPPNPGHFFLSLSCFHNLTTWRLVKGIKNAMISIDKPPAHWSHWVRPQHPGPPSPLGQLHWLVPSWSCSGCSYLSHLYHSVAATFLLLQPLAAKKRSWPLSQLS